MSLEVDVELLARVPLFSDLGGDQLRLLAFSAVHQELARGQVLFRAGDPARSGYVVARGAIDLRGDDTGLRAAETCGPSCLIGEQALFVETTRRADAQATVPSEVIEIGRGSMHRMLTEYPAVAAALRSRMAARLAATMADLDQVRRALLGIAG